ncbi:DUF2161 domain-containing phosphodiesterase [Roseivivax sediminis]|uniref:Uncharacterized protein n=1 Tax=Roseivivax sediminis TaxID=936889 RepID=A0A1I1W1B3_9RHOB|nr:DUF2161 family putative PD-(D/E)XK-type phosphodiesterase [Roseivivax sediminis]SFD88944.1 hypothetical protein SAMN04515678_10474 [Roseivivax sediminis]
MTRERDLYAPVKAWLEALGYAVKGEVGAADLVACRDGAPAVVVELKLGLSLRLYHQAVARLALTDHVYIAVPAPKGRTARRILAENTRLCRRLGLGFLTVRPDGKVDLRCDPGPYVPRRNRKAEAKLLGDFARLRGDPNDGGATRHGLVTGYRQDALACAAHLAEAGEARARDVAAATGVAGARRIMSDNHYGWFVRVSRGVYGISDTGRAGLVHWAGSWEG